MSDGTILTLISSKKFSTRAVEAGTEVDMLKRSIASSRQDTEPAEFLQLHKLEHASLCSLP